MIDSEKARIVDEVQLVYGQLTRYSAQADLDRFMDCYLDCPPFTHISGDGEMRGYAGFKEICSAYYNALDHQTIDTIQQKTDVITDSIVIIAWKGNIKAEFKNGDTMIMNNYSVTSVWQKMDRGWKITHSHESALPTEVIKMKN